MRQLGHPTAAMVIGVIAIIALPTVLLAFLYGQSRIFFVMSRDGLLPRRLSKVNARTGTPVATTLFTAVVVSALAGVARLDEIAALANAGTLAAFTAVGICLVVLRLREPNRAGRAGLHLPVHQPAAYHPAVLPAVERGRPGAVLPVQPSPRADREIDGSPVVPAAGRQPASC